MITRRKFLGGTAAFGAALFTPLSMLGSLAGREGHSLTAPLLEPAAGEQLITILTPTIRIRKSIPFRPTIACTQGREELRGARRW